jgi:glycosyltransferase involved in cell wall biosynthesis
MTRRVAVAIPALQAEAFVADIVRRTLAVLPDLLVIDDGSSDHTGDVARSAGAEVITMPHNRGKGAALRAAFCEFFRRGYEAVVTLDADGQHLPEEIPKLLSGWEEGGDLVLGTRERLYSQMGRLRRTSNRASSRAISIVAGTRLRDVQTGFRLYTRPLIAATGFPEPRFEAETAVIVRAVRRGFSIITVPIDLGYADGLATSHYRPILDSLRITVAVARARVERISPSREPWWLS